MKSPGLLLAVPLAAALLGAGFLLGRHTGPAPGVPVPEGRAVAAPAAPRSPLAGLPMSPVGVKPFNRTGPDLRREAAAAEDSSAATLRLTLLLAGTPAADLARLAGEIAWGKQTSRWEDMAVRAAVLRRWAETDPKDALAWTAGLPKRARRSARQQILAQSARVDADGALKFARGLRDPRERADAVAAVADVLARTDPRGALRREPRKGGARVRSSPSGPGRIRSQPPTRPPSPSPRDASAGRPSVPSSTNGRARIPRRPTARPSRSRRERRGNGPRVRS